MDTEGWFWIRTVGAPRAPRAAFFNRCSSVTVGIIGRAAATGMAGKPTSRADQLATQVGQVLVTETEIVRREVLLQVIE